MQQVTKHRHYRVPRKTNRGDYGGWIHPLHRLEEEELATQNPHRDEMGNKINGFHRNLLVIIPELDSGFLKIPKNAMSAVGRCISDRYPNSTTVEKNECVEIPKEITVLWRNPRERTESLFRMASATSMTAVRNGKIPHPKAGFEEWVLQLLQKPLINDHCVPQTDLCYDESGRYLPTRDFFMDDMDQLLQHYGLTMVPVERQNRSPRSGELTWSDAALQLHQDVYQADWDKWESRLSIR